MCMCVCMCVYVCEIQVVPAEKYLLTMCVCNVCEERRIGCMLDIVHVYMYTGIKVYGHSISIQHVCQRRLYI